MCAIPVINPAVFEEAAASDARRATNLPIRPLEGIPYLVKDSIKVKGMAVPAGSPAFEKLISNHDAACIETLREAGAIIIGRTNMPAMAYGGMQRGLYGRPESPYNLGYLTAGYASGSSSGSATATTSSFGAFGLGSETVSSGRSSASNNALVTYTPSKGLLALRGVWPLYPTCDVLAPLSRTVSDLLDVLDVIAVPDKNPTGDFWNEQSFITLPKMEDLRPGSFKDLRNPCALRGKRIGVPTMYIGGEDPLPIKVHTRPSVVELWKQAKRDMEECGATIVEVDFPLIEQYEKYAHTGKLVNVNNLPDGWPAVERGPLVAHAWDDFLVHNGQTGLQSLAVVNPESIFPLAPGSLPGEQEPKNMLRWAEMVEYPKAKPASIFDVLGLEKAVKALEAARKETYEQWMEKNNLDLVVFPANGDVGPADADVDKESSKLAWQNGSKYSNGNRPIRHLGIPTISVPMGIMDDTKMPVNLTLATKAYDDMNLLRYGYAYETATNHRLPPPLTPQLETDLIPLLTEGTSSTGSSGESPMLIVDAQSKRLKTSTVYIHLSGHIQVPSGSSFDLDFLRVYINGQQFHEILIDGNRWQMTTAYSQSARDEPWVKGMSLAATQTMVVILAGDKHRAVAGKLLLL